MFWDLSSSFIVLKPQRYNAIPVKRKLFHKLFLIFVSLFARLLAVLLTIFSLRTSTSKKPEKKWLTRRSTSWLACVCVDTSKILEITYYECCSKGSFNNYVDRILPFFDPPPTPAWRQFLYPEHGQKQTFFDPSPPPILST